MNKEYLETLKIIDELLDNYIDEAQVVDCPMTKERLLFFKQTLQRLESIDNANPSEALKDLKVIENNIIYTLSDCDYNDEVCQNLQYAKTKILPIEQYILNAQELEKKNAYIEKVKTMMKQKDCVLRYIESEDCFAVKAILSDGWYKLTPEFVENNVREEIEPLPLIIKNQRLKRENDKYKRVFDIIKEKPFESATTINYIQINKDNPKMLDYEHYTMAVKYVLPEEDFETLVRYIINE